MLAKKAASFALRLPVSPYPKPKPLRRVVRAGAPDPWPADRPLVTLVIPCFNYGHFLEAALSSVRAQTLQDLEVVVIDDGSTDPDTRKVLDALEAKGVRVVRQPNGGLARTRNRGAELARGKYVCFLDPDDVLEPTYLEKAAVLLERIPSLGSAYSWLRCFGESEEVWETEELRPDTMRERNLSPSHSVLRKAAWEEVRRRNGEGYQPRWDGVFEDWVFWIDMMTAGYGGRVIPEPLIRYRVHAASLSARNRERFGSKLAALKEERPAFFSKESGRAAAARAPFEEVEATSPLVNLSRSGQYRAGENGVVFVLPYLSAGGVEAVTLEIVRRLGRDGRAVYVLTTEADANTWHDRFYELTPLLYHLPHIVDRDQQVAFLENFVSTRRPGVLCGIHSSAFYLLATRLAERPAESPPLVCDVLHNDSILGYLEKSVAADASHDRHVVISSRIAATIQARGVDPAKVVTVTNGVDVSGRFDPTRPGPAGAPSAPKTADGTVRILFLGRLSPEKRPHDFLALASSLRGEPRLRFLMAGDGPLQESVRTAVARRRQTNVELLGHADPREALERADVLALTSEVEGLPLAVLEALSMGVAVISTDVGDVSRVVHDGRNGFLVPVEGAVEAMRERLTRYLREPGLLEEHRRRARPSVGGHSTERMTEGYLAAFRPVREARGLEGGQSPG